MMSLLNRLAGLALAVVVSTTGALAQDEDGSYQILRDEGLDWLLPVESCPADLIPEQSVTFDIDRRSCEDHLAECVDACRTRDAERCYTSASTHEALGNEAHADGLYQQACRLGATNACTNFAARMRSIGSGDEACIANTFFETCEREDPWGCAMASVVVWQAEGVSQDGERARAFAEKTCAIEADLGACSLAGDILAEIDESETGDE